MVTAERKWLETCRPYFQNHDEGGASMIKALATENDLAESLGYECKPCDRRGHGWCYFSKDAGRREVRSAWVQWDGVFYPWAAWDYEDGRAVRTVLYSNLVDALHGVNPCWERKKGEHSYQKPAK